MEKSGKKVGKIRAKEKAMAGVLLLAVMIGAVMFLFNMAFDIWDPVSRNNRAFSKAVKQWAAQAQEGDRISLRELTPFSWNWVYTFDPYTTKDEMEQVIGCSGKDLSETVNEGMVQLVFVDYDKDLGENRVVCDICGYGSNLGYGVNLGLQFGQKSNYMRLTQGMDQMTLRKGSAYPSLVFEGEIFEGTIVELYGQSVLVSVDEGWPIRSSGDQVIVQLHEAQEETADIGDRIRVHYDGMVMESCPLQLGGQMDTVILEE